MSKTVATVVQRTNPKTFVDGVNAMLEKGWKTEGGVSVHYDRGTVHYTLLMTRENPDTTPEPKPPVVNQPTSISIDRMCTSRAKELVIERGGHPESVIASIYKKVGRKVLVKDVDKYFPAESS